MKKTTIELKRFQEHPAGYGLVYDEISKTDKKCLNALVDWSKNKNITIYDHDVRRIEENFNKYKKVYEPKGFTAGPPNYGQLKIPYCDLVFYLDIYYQ